MNNSLSGISSNKLFRNFSLRTSYEYVYFFANLVPYIFATVFSGKKDKTMKKLFQPLNFLEEF